MENPDVIPTVRELRTRVRGWREQGARIALVPTMGALHAGHLSLVQEARKNADRVIVSIFVNPAQFAPYEDFDRYPRNLGKDRAWLAEQEMTDAVFSPGLSELYPDGFATKIHVAGPALGLESDVRPHFFAGVATVVAKLLIAASPHVAVFGEKDYQQLLVVRRVTRDLGLDVEIMGAPIVREPDGLALSSRNAYLGARERKIAGQLNRVLADVATRVREGAPISAAERNAVDALGSAGFDSVDYVAVRNANTLAPLKMPAQSMRVLAAATTGKTRLIDNVPV
jgi:pantoate--beta-alanine ligase